MLALLFVVSWLTTEKTLVCGLKFTLSESRVILGTKGKLFMTCNVTEKDAKVVYDVQIRRETSTKFGTLAVIEAGVTEVPALDKHVVDDKDFVTGGMLDKENPLNTHLTLQMNIEKMTYDDAGVYRCEMTYKSNIFKTIATIDRNGTLLIVEAENKTDGRAGTNSTGPTNTTKDNIQKSSKSDNGNSSVTVSTILGVTNILTVVYAAYLTAVIRKSRTRSFDDVNVCHGRREPEPTPTVAKQGLAVDQQTYSINDDEDTYDLS